MKPNRFITLLLILAFLVAAMPAWAQSSSINITTSICDPNFCPISKTDYAKSNNCKFLEDICPGVKQDNKGAKEEDKGFWGEAWDTIAGGATYGYEFMKGLATGLLSQVTDLWDLVSSPIETAKGLIALGKAFYDDPKGTTLKLAEVLGKEAVNAIIQSTQCGPYYLGNVIGKYVSPAVALKIAGKLGKFGKLDDVVKAVKKDFGCASFAAGTPVWTSTGSVSIQSISIGQIVESRHDQKWSQIPQKVNNTFSRSAPSYYQLRTEEESFQVTEEHPLWVQGKGWTPAKDLTDEDVLVTIAGDTLVKAISKVNKPLQVYNFAVENTPNYFVGNSGLWAHNTKCDLPNTEGGRPILREGGFYSADGFKFSEKYYNYLWVNGRPAPFLQARSILDGNPKITPDPRGAPGYFRYEANGLEMIYNPVTGQVGHIQPIR
jgi:Pretoxin HINT domain